MNDLQQKISQLEAKNLELRLRLKVGKEAESQVRTDQSKKIDEMVANLSRWVRRSTTDPTRTRTRTGPQAHTRAHTCTHARYPVSLYLLHLHHYRPHHHRPHHHQHERHQPQ